MRVLGEKDLSVAQTRYSLAEVLFKAKHMKEARKEMEKAVDVVKKIAGKEHDFYKAYTSFLEQIKQSE